MGRESKEQNQFGKILKFVQILTGVGENLQYSAFTNIVVLELVMFFFWVMYTYRNF